MNETVDRAPTARLESLDALRGFDMLFISGLSSLVASACVMLGCPECWLAEQMRHVADGRPRLNRLSVEIDGRWIEIKLPPKQGVLLSLGK